MDSRTAKPGNFSYEAEDGLLFRMLTKEDAAEVAALEKECFSEPWSEQAFCDTVDNPDAFFLTVWQDGQLAGYCGVFRAWTDGDICNVAVEPAKRKQGLGRRMLTLLMKHAAPGANLVFRPEMLEAAAVYCLRVSSLTGKRRERKQ